MGGGIVPIWTLERLKTSTGGGHVSSESLVAYAIFAILFVVVCMLFVILDKDD